MSLSKKLRFEVFKRDQFTCQYCGEMAPVAILQVDHIEPKSKGGKNDILNLIASCRDCNIGKSDRKLTETAVISKKKEQLKLLAIKREQLQMMVEWQNELLNIEEEENISIANFWSKLTDNQYTLNERGIATLAKLKKKFSFNEILEAMKIAKQQYFKIDDDGKLQQESIEYGFKKIGGICYIKKTSEFDPVFQRVSYLMGIIRNRFSWIEGRRAGMLKKEIREAVDQGSDIEELIEYAKNCKNWTQWKEFFHGE